jgi:hypothetical protein
MSPKIHEVEVTVNVVPKPKQAFIKSIIPVSFFVISLIVFLLIGNLNDQQIEQRAAPAQTQFAQNYEATQTQIEQATQTQIAQATQTQIAQATIAQAVQTTLIAQQGQPQLPFPNYTISLNYDQTVEQMIKAGKYDWFNDDVTSQHFSSNEKGQAEILVYLISFNRYISSEDAIKELDRQGLRPATLKELLALGVAQPDLQRSNPIVALGSMWPDSSGDVGVPYLSGDESNRSLSLRWWSGDWNSSWQFAAVRK